MRNQTGFFGFRRPGYPASGDTCGDPPRLCHATGVVHGAFATAPPARLKTSALADVSALTLQGQAVVASAHKLAQVDGRLAQGALALVQAALVGAILDLDADRP